MAAFMVRLLAASAILAVAAPVPGQTPQNPAEAAGQALKNEANPVRPVLFSIRPEFYRTNADIARTSLNFRYDQAALRARRWLPGKRGIVLRFELPISEAHGARIASQVGIGDAYGQFLLVPYITRTRGFVVGTGLVLPSGSDTLLGGGKWVLAPAAGPLWFFGGRGLFFLKLQDFVSFAGDASRPEVHFFLVTPTFVHTIGRRWWVLADTETRTNWLNDARTTTKAGLQAGRNLSPGFAVWAKPELWWGPNEEGGWNLKFGIIWYR